MPTFLSHLWIKHAIHQAHSLAHYHTTYEMGFEVSIQHLQMFCRFHWNTA